jgi:hypothetical protein
MKKDESLMREALMKTHDGFDAISSVFPWEGTFCGMESDSWITSCQVPCG